MSLVQADARAAGGLPRAVEAGVALGALVLLLPLLALLAVAVVTTSPGGLLFRQTRIGRHGRPFEMLKFRSMRRVSGREVTAADDPRITLVGRWLRRWKLDELPELWNVLVGEMSLVGPRPEVAVYVDLEDPRWLRALTVRPGLTDPVTLSLRDEESLLATVRDVDDFYRRYLLPYKLAGYLAYLDRRSWRSDLQVLARTALAVIAPSLVEAASIEELMGGDSDR